MGMTGPGFNLDTPGRNAEQPPVAERTPMTLAEIPFPAIDPVAFEIGPIAVRWYGLAYMAGLILGWLYVRSLLRTPAIWRDSRAPFAPERVDDLLLYVIAGVILGGRLGHVLFYEPAFYAANPLEIPQLWKGGMSFHGGLIGCGLAIYAFGRRNGVNVWSAMDLCAAAVPIGLFFGRIANFINGEVFGRPTSMPWGMVFPNAAVFPGQAAIEPTPRHPSQLYEAALEGVVLFLALRLLTHSYEMLKSPGLTTGVFLAGYGLARSVSELFRQPDPTHWLTIPPLTPGIAYSIPMIALGLMFIWWARSRARAAA